MYWLPLLISLVAAAALLLVLVRWRWLPAYRLPLAALLILTGAGSYSFWILHEWRPSERDVERVEAAIARHPCAGRLVTKHREYSYGVTDHAGEPNLHWIEFQLRSGRPTGRSIRAPGADFVDEEREQVAAGHYVLSSGRLTVTFCNADTLLPNMD